MNASAPHPRNQARDRDNSICRLTVFSFLWACQALVHQEFYSGWLHQNDPRGWTLTVFAVAVLLFPRSLWLFAGMLISSVVYNVVKWPFVVNHILLESVVNFTILLAMSVGLVGRRSGVRITSVQGREELFDRFAPVVRLMLIVMYYYAFVAKLNWDFFDPEISAVSAMYADLARRLPFLPTAIWAKVSSIWLTIVIEAAIPILLSFRRTRYLAIIIGLPFHFMLGLIGHRTFSALAFALYGLFFAESLATLVQRGLDSARDHFGRRECLRWLWFARGAVAVSTMLLIGADLTGNFHAGFGPLLVYRIPWAVWGLWSFVVAAVYIAAMLRDSRDERIEVAHVHPGIVWLMVPVVLLNGASQYLGFKTETCFTMYSNLRTEGERNNHLFLPALRLANYQDDLVEIVSTDYPELQGYIDRDQYIVYFELRRLLSESRCDVQVTYIRNGTTHRMTRNNGISSDPALAERHPRLLAKLLYFRPVFKGDKAHFQH